MKNLTRSIYTILLIGVTIHGFAQEPRAFYTRCLVTSITGGPSSAIYTTWNKNGDMTQSDRIRGTIDPLIMEYGITNKIGVGFSRGGENYDVDVNKFYKADLPEGNNLMWASTKYLTLDFSYHPFVTKRIDVSLFASAGFFRITGSVYNYPESVNSSATYIPPTQLFNYNAKGAIVRTGVRSRIYFSKRFGVMGMLYTFNGFAKEKPKAKPITDAQNNTGYSTMLTGIGAEFGICFRIFKQKGVINTPKKAKVREEKEEKDRDHKPLFRLVWD